jgi:hypothetical protein
MGKWVLALVAALLFVVSSTAAQAITFQAVQLPGLLDLNAPKCAPDSCPQLPACQTCGYSKDAQKPFTTDGVLAGNVPDKQYLYWGSTGIIYVQPLLNPAIAPPTAFPASDTYTVTIAPPTTTAATGQNTNIGAVAVAPLTFGTQTWKASDCPSPLPLPARSGTAATDGGQNVICAAKAITVQGTTNGVSMFQPSTPTIFVPMVFSGRRVTLNWLVTCASTGGVACTTLGGCDGITGTAVAPTGTCSAGLPGSIFLSTKPIGLRLPGGTGGNTVLGDTSGYYLPNTQTPPNVPAPGGYPTGDPLFDLGLDVGTSSLPFSVALGGTLTSGGGATDPNLVGTVTLTPALWDTNFDPVVPPATPTRVRTQVATGTGVSQVTFVPAVATLSPSNPSASFRLANFPNANPICTATSLCVGGGIGATADHYAVYFNDPNGLAGTAGAAASTGNPTVIFEVPYFRINIKAVSVTIPNWPPTNLVLYVTPQVAGSTNPSTGGNYLYQMRLRRNPQDIVGTSGSIVISANIISRGNVGTPTPLTFVGAGVSGSGNAFSFTFAGTTPVITFQVFTQSQQSTYGSTIDIEWTLTSPAAPITSVFITGLGTAGAGGVCTGTTCSLCGTGSQLNCDVTRNVLLKGLTIRENPIQVRLAFADVSKVGGSPGKVAPYVGEPFYLDYSWIPPLQNGMTLTVSGLYTAEISPAQLSTGIPFSAPIGATSLRAGPFTPTIPPNVDPTADSFELVYTLGMTSSGQTDASWFGYYIYGARNAATFIVKVNKRYLVSSSLSRTAAQPSPLTVNLASTGVATPPICLSLNLPISTYGPNYPITAADQLVVTPIGFVTGGTVQNRAGGLIFNNTRTSASTLQFSSGIQTECFTVAYDTKFKLSVDGAYGSTGYNFDITWQFGGTLKEQFVNPYYCEDGVTGAAFPTGACSGVRPVNFPNAFALIPNPIYMGIADSQGLGGTGFVAAGAGLSASPVVANFFAGENRTLIITTDWPSPNGVSYALYAPGLSLTPTAATLGFCSTSNGVSFCTFAPNAAGSANQAHYWTVGTNGVIPGWTSNGPTAPHNDVFKTSINMDWVNTGSGNGGDNALYSLPSPVDVSVAVRRVYVDGWAATPTIHQGYPGAFRFNLRVGEPVLNQLIVTPTVANGNSGALTFTPSFAVFTPGSSNVVAFTVTGNLLSVGTIGSGWLTRFVLSGTDKNLFWVSNPGVAQDSFVKVDLRPAPTITPLDSLASPGNNIYAGILYGPMKITLDRALAAQESITFSFGNSDWVFYETVSGTQITSITMNGNQGNAVFSARAIPTFPSAVNQVVSRIFFTFSGPDAWKFNYPGQVTGVTPVAPSLGVSPFVAPVLGDSVGIPNNVGALAAEPPVLGRHTYVVNRRLVTVTFQGEPSTNSLVAVTSGASAAVVIGVRHYGQVVVNFPTAGLTITPSVAAVAANSASVTFEPPSWSLDNVAVGTVLQFNYTVTAFQNFISGPANNNGDLSDPKTTPLLPSTGVLAGTPSGIQVSFNVSGTESGFHQVPTPALLYVVRRNFLWDVNGASPAAQGQAGSVKNLRSLNFNNHFVVGRRSQTFSVVVTTTPTQSVTLTIAHPAITFTPSTLTWAPNDVAKTFTFVPTTIPPSGDWAQQFEIIVGGSEAQYYDYQNVFNVLRNIVILPALSFSPIPVTYIDQAATGMNVQLAQASPSFPYPADRAFSLHIFSPAPQGIHVEPSALPFSPSTGVSQTYSITHVYPNVVDSVIDGDLTGSALAFAAGFNSGTDSYRLGWGIKFVGTNNIIPITNTIVPQEVQRVVVARYQIIPSFPQVLAYAWQPASFNLTRAPISHMTLVPHQPDRDGANGQRARFGAPAGAADALSKLRNTYGAGLAAGKIVTEPPAITFDPGQTVAVFQVRAIFGAPNQYYRLDWQLSGARDDSVCYVESADSSPMTDGPYTFSTYHQASAFGVTASFATLIACVLFAALF